MVDIFVSYESSDRPRAESLRSLFEDHGWTVWVDGRIPVGDAWEPHLDRELNSARLVVVLWGAQALCDRIGAGAEDDRDGVLHRMVEDFLGELERLVPAPGAVH